jgi:hypothetical protein
MSSSPAAAPTRARSVNGPLPQLLLGPGRLASPTLPAPPAAPRWLRLVPVRVVFLVVLALAVLGTGPGGRTGAGTPVVVQGTGRGRRA